MDFLKSLFGIGANEPQKAAPPLTIPTGWGLSEAEIESLAATYSTATNPTITRRKDPMDDADFLILSIKAVEFECADLEDAPTLLFRARKVGYPTTVDTFVHFKDNFFWGRGKDPTVRLRFDELPPKTCNEGEAEYGTTKSTMHFEDLEILQQAIRRKKMLLQIQPQRGHSLLAQFGFEEARPATEEYAKAVFGEGYREALTINPVISDFILRMGPKNVLTKKQALSALGFEVGPISYEKNGQFLSAIEKYARSRRASEIVGLFDDGRVCSPWHSHLYQEAPRRIKAEMGDLKIFD